MNESTYISARTKHRLKSLTATTVEIIEVHASEVDIHCVAEQYGRAILLG